jgi:hypothetical protein
MQVAPAFAEMLESRKPGWLARAKAQDLALAFGGAARTLGKSPLAPTASERAKLLAAGVDWALDTWGVDELGRVTLLLEASADQVRDAFFRGDNRERQAALKCLALRTDAASFVDLAVESCRTNVLDVFEAIACENPFPARHFPEPNFNQLVLKAIFMGVRVERIVDLPARVTPELVRMARDYASERRAAGRVVPDDVTVLETLGGSA